MTKKIPYIFWTLSFVYIFLNFKRIRGAFQSNIWSKELTLETHVANFSVHVQVISVLLVIGSLLLTWAMWEKNSVSKLIIWPLLIIALVLFINTQIDFIRWIEINVFGGGGLLLFTLFLLINVIWRSFKVQIPINDGIE